MRVVFVELPAFERYREEYLSENGFRDLQKQLISQPEIGSVIRGSGRLRKMRFADSRRHKGTRGGLRVIYFLWKSGNQIWLFTLYDKDEMDDLQDHELMLLKIVLKYELEKRK